MVSKIIVIDSKLDQILECSPGEAIRLIQQEYQIAYDKPAFVIALAAKLVTRTAMQRLRGTD